MTDRSVEKHLKVSDRFTLHIFSKASDKGSPWKAGLLASLIFVVDGSVEANNVDEFGDGLTIRLTDLVTGRTVDEYVGTWNAQIEAEYELMATKLPQLSDDEILRHFFATG